MRKQFFAAAALAMGTALAGMSAAAAGDTLNFGCFSYADTLDPAVLTNSSWCLTRYGIGECLFRFNENMEAEPYLCDSYEVSEDHLTWTFHIREGVRFSNGNAVTPSAVVASIQRVYDETDPEKGGTGAATPRTYMEYESMTADDEAGTVTIVTSKPYADLTGRLAYPCFCIIDVSEEEAGKNIGEEGPSGTGPYVVEEFAADQYVLMSANEYYWNGDVPFENVQITFVDDDTTKAMALQNGDVDMVENITSASALAQIEAMPDQFTVSRASSARTGFAFLNMDGILGNETLRQAVQMALDHDTMCNITVGGMYIPGYSILPSALDYGYEELTNPYSYDPEAAKALLDEAGIVDTDGDGVRELDGENINLNYVTYTNRNLSDFAQAVQVYLSQIGIGVTIQTTDADTNWNLISAGEYDLGDQNWITVGTGDPTDFLGNWYSKSESNFGRYANEEYDAVYESLLAELDTDQRKEDIRQLQQILLDDGVAIVHGYYTSSMCSSKAIENASIGIADYYWLTSEITPVE